MSTAPAVSADERSIDRRITWRLIPFLFVLYIAAFLDRVNISFAEKSMGADLGFDSRILGFGMGIFFLGYFLFEVPSNLLLERVGPRRWIARIMISWGILSSLMMVVNDPLTFYILRFLLGVAEAGFFPGIILYLTYWFPAARRGAAVSRFMMAVPIAGVIGSPLSGQLLRLDGMAGLHGWQWMFLLEGIPSVILGILVLFCLPNHPREVHWLTAAEVELLENRLKQDGAATAHTSLPWYRLLQLPQIFQLSLLYFCTTCGMYGFTFWLPKLLRQALPEFSDFHVSLLAILPWVLATASMWLIGQHSDRLRERRLHLVALFAWSLLQTQLLVQNPSGWGAVACLALIPVGIYGSLGIFWALATPMLKSAPAGGIALVNSVGNLGGFVAPFLFGALLDATGDARVSLLTMGGFLLLGLVVLLSLARASTEADT